jgi:F0F1-type ATP synthase delta subunit
MEQASSEKIASIILQLVQAFKYENFNKTSLKDFLLKHAITNKKLANQFFWYVKLETENKDECAAEICEQYNDLFTEFLDMLEDNDAETFKSLNEQFIFRDRLL